MTLFCSFNNQKLTCLQDVTQTITLEDGAWDKFLKLLAGVGGCELLMKEMESSLLQAL